MITEIIKASQNLVLYLDTTEEPEPTKTAELLETLRKALSVWEPYQRQFSLFRTLDSKVNV